jgi:hypothetical protein
MSTSLLNLSNELLIHNLQELDDEFSLSHLIDGIQKRQNRELRDPETRYRKHAVADIGLMRDILVRVATVTFHH